MRPSPHLIALLLTLLLTPTISRAAEDPAAPALTLTAEDLATRPALTLVPEMQLVPESDGWPATDPKAFPESAANFNAQWAKLSPWVSQKLTPNVARALSRWSAPQMKTYAAVPAALDKLAFTPVASLKAQNLIVYQATADRLPTHSPLVFRNLVLYVTYSPESKSIARVTITIRGHVEE